jgi:hypothetical protein
MSHVKRGGGGLDDHVMAVLCIEGQGPDEEGTFFELASAGGGG